MIIIMTVSLHLFYILTHFHYSYFARQAVHVPTAALSLTPDFAHPTANKGVNKGFIETGEGAEVAIQKCTCYLLVNCVCSVTTEACHQS